MVTRHTPRRFRPSLPSRIALLVTLSMVLAVGLITAVQLWLFRENLRQTLFTEQETFSTAVAANLEQQLTTLKNALISSARAVTEADVASGDAAQRYLDTNAGLNAIFERSVFLFSPSGDLIAERPFLPNRRGQNFAWRDYLRGALQRRGPVISEPFVTTKDDRHAVIMFATPVFSRDGREIIAVNTGSFGLTHPVLLGNLANTVVGRTGYIYLVTRDGALVMHPDKSRLLQRAFPRGGNPVFERALAGFEGVADTIDPEGRRVISSFKHIPSTQWMVVTVYPQGEAFSSFNQLVRNLLVIFVLSMVAAGAMVGFLARGLVQKIQSKNETLRRIKADSLQKLRTRNQFFNEASHDFRQRLHGMQLLINTAERTRTPSNVPAIFTRVKSAVADLQRYLDNFLEITRFETVSVFPVKASVVLQDVFQRLELQFEDAAMLRRVDLRLRPTPLVLHTDEKMLLRILENLLSNALKFCDGVVLVTARQRGQAIEIRVMDDGAGISEAEKAAIFDAFVQGRSAERSRVTDGGFGLGLSIVLRSVVVLGATIDVRSTGGRGTTVSVVFPKEAMGASLQ